MPFQLVTDSWNCEIGSQDPWPDDVELYQPYENVQILLNDSSNCIAVKAFLNMCGLKHTVKHRTNAEYMSPTGRVPFIRCGKFLISEFDAIVTFVGNKGIRLTSNLDSTQKADLRAFTSLVHTVLGNAEHYLSWVDPLTYQQVTKPRYGATHPFPLNHILPYLKKQQIIKKLSLLGWYSKPLDKVFEEVEKCCLALNDRLGESKFFFGNTPCELDALVYGHYSAVEAFQNESPYLSKFNDILQHNLNPIYIAGVGRLEMEDYLSIKSESLRKHIGEHCLVPELPEYTELDALVFGHIFTLATTVLPDNRLSQIVLKFDRLIEHSKRIEKGCFPSEEEENPS